MNVIEKIKDLLKRANSSGIPVPLIKDPKTGQGSVSLTLVFISSLHVQAALVGKISNLVQGLDIEHSLQFFLITSGLYFGRSIATKSVSVDEKPIQKE